MDRTNRALVLKSPNELQVEDRIIGPLESSDILVKVAAASTCHTDLVVMRGEYPGTKYPTVLGHEFSGIILECGKDVRNFRPGDRITSLSYTYCGTCFNCRRGIHNGCVNSKGIPFHMDGAFQQMVIIPSIMAFKIQDSLSLDEAALTEPAANACAVVERASIYPGEKVVIIGPGAIGLISLQFAVMKQPSLIVMLGTRNERLLLAKKFGADITINVKENDPYSLIMDSTNGKGADVVLFCGGGQDAWELAGQIMAPFGRIIVEALPEVYETRWSVKIFDFTAKNIGYLGVCGYNGAQFGATLELMQAGKINVKDIISHKFSIDDYKNAFDTCINRREGAIKILFRPNG